MTRTLIIGGSRFLGPALIKLLLGANHEVTVFNRGNDYGHALPPAVRQIKGDRREAVNIEVLGQVKYDYVYDMCCYNQDDATIILNVLEPPAHLILLSTAAVYAKPRTLPLYETSELGAWKSFGDYGTNKVLAERAFTRFAESNGSTLTIFRPVYLLGPDNYFDRENYYFSRLEAGKPILMPGTGNALLQVAFLDETARMFHQIPALQKTQFETLNLAGSEYVSIRDLVQLCAEIAGKTANIITVDGPRFEMDEEHFYDDLYPFPNLNFIVSNDRIVNRYHAQFQTIDDGLRSTYASWKAGWDGKVRMSSREKDILNTLR